MSWTLSGFEKAVDVGLGVEFVGELDSKSWGMRKTWWNSFKDIEVFVRVLENEKSKGMTIMTTTKWKWIGRGNLLNEDGYVISLLVLQQRNINCVVPTRQRIGIFDVRDSLFVEKPFQLQPCRFSR